ncbi:hypothetical protein DM02DRAFT_656215 [Periconia macrospinosa]|uniref:Uncharacterized protein n=1 Tax=Periconia macrospinosa TaxID=97972 RepID=A0A2V1DQW9_9PLEO|nr:hypothetical protein DM02DRAFT_656215 [Periconia macrospinosa]
MKTRERIRTLTLASTVEYLLIYAAQKLALLCPQHTFRASASISGRPNTESPLRALFVHILPSASTKAVFKGGSIPRASGRTSVISIKTHTYLHRPWAAFSHVSGRSICSKPQATTRSSDVANLMLDQTSNGVSPLHANDEVQPFLMVSPGFAHEASGMPKEP